MKTNRLIAPALALAAALCGAPDTARASGTLRSPSGPLRTAYTHVHVTIDGQTARTDVDQVFVNDLPGPVEASFAFPLPADATVTGFADWRDGRRQAAAVAGREAAAAAYDAALAAGRRAALGEIEGPDKARFRMHLDAVPGQGSRRVSLSYVQSLDALGSARTFVFPAEGEGTPSVLDLEVDVAADDASRALTAIATPNHGDARIAGRGARRVVTLTRAGAGLGRDFVLTWSQPSAALDLAVRGARRAAGESAYVEARLAFDRDPFEGERPPRDVVLLLDASLSMAGEPLRREKALAAEVLGALGPQDRVALLVLRGEVEAWVPALTPVGAPVVQSAARALERLRAGGRTDLSAGLDAAGSLLAKSADGVLLLATDGQPTADALGGDDPFGIDVDASRFAAARVVIAQLVWPRRGYELAQLFPQATPRYLPDGPAGDEAATAVVRLVTAPVIEDLSVVVEGEGVRDVEGALPGRLARGESLRLMARADGPATVRVEGLLHGVPVALSARLEPETAPAPLGDLLALEWARARVSGLEAVLARAEEGERAEAGAEIRSLGLTYGIATRLTSFTTAPVADALGPDRIKPGDPEVRIRAARNALAVLAVLPWGEVVRCTWDEGEGLWLGRFLVPRGVADGLYRVRVLVQSQGGWVARGALFFRVDSAPPAFELTLETPDGLPVSGPGETDAPLRLVARPGDHVFDDEGGLVGTPEEGIVRDRLDLKRIEVQVDEVTLTMERVGAGERWEALLPPDLPPGRHTVRLLAVDYALNSTVATLDLEVP